MALDVTVVVPYTGEPWRTWAHERAIPSAAALGAPVVIGEGASVAEARNNGLAQVRTEWTIHLDADDELDAGYLDAMATGSADVRAPSAVWLAHPNLRTRQQTPFVPVVWGHTHGCVAECLELGNWLVVGAMVRTSIARAVGWQEWPVYEDYDFWLRCYRAGATFEAIPAAVYRAYSRRGGRNTKLHPQERHRVHQEIAAASGAVVPA